jgi:adenylate cyclase
MGIEIERKFLVTGKPWSTADKATVYQQGYLNRDPQRTVRVRVAGNKAMLTIKGLSQGATRDEFEYEIPVKDAEALLKLCEGPVIDKTRHFIVFEGKTWEVDEFHGDNEGLIMAEVELQNEEEMFALPPWVTEEVTGDDRYYNSALSVKPFKKWD